MKKIKLSTTNPVTFKFYEFFHSKLGGPTVVQGMGEKNKVWEASGIASNSKIGRLHAVAAPRAPAAAADSYSNTTRNLHIGVARISWTSASEQQHLS
jgi:hypothetical protein